MQAAFVTEAMGLLQDEDVHTALDTCGYARWPDLRQAARRADLVLYDLKLMDEARHRAVTGVSNRPILDNLLALTAVHGNIWIRVPIVPGINDDEANLEATVAFLRPLPGIARVDLLPYHPTGEAKFARVGLDCTVHGTPPPEAAHLDALAARVRAAGLNATIGGHP
jgi:pyruvate formate lyase activating enzyme